MRSFRSRYASRSPGANGCPLAAGSPLVGKRLGDPSLERVDVQLQAIGIRHQALESLGGGLGGRGADRAGASAGRSPSSMSATCAVSRTVSRKQVRDLARLDLDEAARLEARRHRELGRELDPERIEIPVADAQQPVFDVHAQVVAFDLSVPALPKQLPRQPGSPASGVPAKRTRGGRRRSWGSTGPHDRGRRSAGRGRRPRGSCETLRRSRRRARMHRGARASKPPSRPGTGAPC